MKQRYESAEDIRSDEPYKPCVVTYLGHIEPTPARKQPKPKQPAPDLNLDSPVASIRHVLVTLAITAITVALLGARGIVQNAQEMSNSPAQAFILSVGNTGMTIDGIVNIVWPWDDFEAALGRPQQPKTSLFFQNLTPTPTPAPTRVTPGHHGPTTPPKPKAPPIVLASKSRPLRILVTGDSLVDFMGPQILNVAASQGPVSVTTDSHDGTGLTKNTILDWPWEAGQQIKKYSPDVVVIMMGGNDFQNMALPNGAYFWAGSRSWTREYQRRAEIVMHQWLQGGVRRIYWMSMPPSSNSTWSHDYHQINVAIQGAAHDVLGAKYVNILGPITNHGKYSDYVPVNGVPTLIREPDGVHLNYDGSLIVANEIVPVIKRDFKFGWSQVVAREHAKATPLATRTGSARKH